MLLREYPVERWFVIPPLLANVLHYLGKHEPVRFCLFSHARYSLRPPMSSARNQSQHIGWSSGDSSEFRISSKLVKWFRSCGWSKFVLLHGFHQIDGKTAKSVWKGKFRPLTAELLFISSRQYLVMEYSIVLSVTHVYQVCHRVIVGHCVRNVCCSSSSLDCKWVVSITGICCTDVSCY